MRDKKTKVLCFFRYHAMVDGCIETHEDAIMIFVDKSSDIKEQFETAMRINVSRWNSVTNVGPKPYSYKIRGWMADNGLRHF